MERSKKKFYGDSGVDIHNDKVMISLGIRAKDLETKDNSAWEKTDQERKLLKSLRHSHKGKIGISTAPRKYIPVEAKLIIYLKKNKYFPNTTYSTICNMAYISDVLRQYCKYDNILKSTVNYVAKYSYNGKTYSPKERPFWR